jgi:hypothetical protein
MTELDLALEGRGMAVGAALATYSQVGGETVFAFGSPIGMRSLSHGLVSAVARQVDLIRR